MGWIRYVSPVVHECRVPRVTRRPKFGVGSVWQCDECDAFWRYSGHPDGAWNEIPAREAFPSGPAMSSPPTPPRLRFVKRSRT
jgi:hypothetical protein